MKNLRKKLFSLLTLIICSIHVMNAQNHIIKGTVTSNQNEPLIGVTVMIKSDVNSAANGTVTDFNGEFSLSASPNASLVFSYVGYKSKTIEVKNQTYISVVLEEDSEILDEVVVVGYGTVKKSDLTGAVSSVKASEISNTAAAGIEVALQGKVPGVFIAKKSGKPGETADIKIRGVGSFNSSGPLWIIDGVQQNPGTEFNMNDAESVEILRDASAAAIYGAAAANGVVIVTTKRGKSGEAKISFNSYWSFNKPTNLPDMLTTEQYKRLKMEDIRGNGRMTEEEIRNFGDVQPLRLDYELTNADYNWKDLLFSTGLTQNYDLSFTKGTDDYNYYASFNYYNEDGTYMDTNFKRFSFRLNSDVKINKWLSFGESLQLTYTQDKPNANSNYLNNYMRTLPFMMPYDENNQPGGFGYFPTVDENGDVLDPDIKSQLGYDGSNLLADELSTHIKQEKYNVNGSVFIKIQPIKDFSVQATLAFGAGVGSYRMEREKFWYHAQKSQMTASVTQNLDRGYGLTGQVVANYHKKFGQHSLTAMIGTEMSKSHGNGLRASAQNMLGGIYQISWADLEYRNVEDSYSNSANFSYFGRINYSLLDRYLFTAVLRRDGSDRFSPKHRWGTFPSFSAAWRISDENFIRDNIDWISGLKLRASWGILGNSGIRQFLYTSNYITYEAGYAYGPGTTQNIGTGIRLDYLPNGDIKWEEISTTDIGLDVGLLNNTLTFSLDWYVKNTSDALFNSTLPRMVGIGKSTNAVPTYIMNIGKIKNTGIDFEASYRNKIGKDFNYTISGNIGHFKNKVIGTNEENEILISGNVLRGGSNVSYTMEGLPMGTFYAYKVAGVFQTQEEVDRYNQLAQEKGWNYYQEAGTGPGDLRFADVDGDGHIDSSDITEVGNPWPKFTYGINLSFNYKFLDFGLFLQGVYGNKIFNEFRNKTHTFYDDYSTTSYALNRWTEAGSTNKNYRMSVEDPNKNESKASTWYVEDGSYLRVKNIQLGFTLPKVWMDKTFISRCRLYVSGQNLLTFTKYEGFDPEFSNSNNTAYGIDSGYYPQNKSFICGVQIDF